MLAGKYTVFGHVIDGLDVLDRMEKVPTGQPPLTLLSCLAAALLGPPLIGTSQISNSITAIFGKASYSATYSGYNVALLVYVVLGGD